ncbi:MAG TPA: UDP-3-O-(3-hydroxymyristoyl)glucosamine N-acyltransferase [Thermodesulfobacteriota bacterium]|nr:UDP-3-O-(3-hydroxymyristoyl)glucosamine N-acyltransferase [Thermodesulfobacteriota bacterium]
MEKTLRELAELAGGEIAGNGDTVLRGVAPLEAATEGDITFIASSKHAESLRTTSASAVIVPPEIQIEGKNLLITRNPQLAFAKILSIYASKPDIREGIDKRGFIGRNPKIGKNVTVYPFVYIGDNAEIGDRTVIRPGTYIGNGCRLGEDVTVYPNATIMEGCIIGNRVIIHPGAVIGSDGFGFARDGKKHYKIPQIGIVQIDDDVEIGANTTIDRASFGKTWIKRGTKIDNLVQVAHNDVIGEDCILVAQSGIAGSCKLGSNVILGGQVGVGDHINIGDNVMVAGQAGVTSDIPDNQVMSGYPTIPHREWLKASLTFPHLPEMRKSINELKKKVAELEAKLKS